jgi:hypothetical protein
MATGQPLPEDVTIGELSALLAAAQYLVFLALACWVVRDFQALRESRATAAA